MSHGLSFNSTFQPQGYGQTVETDQSTKESSQEVIAFINPQVPQPTQYISTDMYADENLTIEDEDNRVKICGLIFIGSLFLSVYSSVILLAAGKTLTYALLFGIGFEANLFFILLGAIYLYKNCTAKDENSKMNKL